MERILALALLVVAAPAFAADAKLARVSGDVSYKTEDEKNFTPAKGGEELIYGDTIKTGPGAVAHVLLTKRGAILIRENSEFTLEGNKKDTVLNFSLGEFLIGLSRKLAEGQTFKVKTPAAIASVRGTLFWGKSDEKRTSTYAGFGHQVEITAGGKTVMLDAGQTVTVEFGQAPSPAKPHNIPVSYTKNFAIGGSLQGLGALVDLPHMPLK
jgi:hypothetical protein